MTDVGLPGDFITQESGEKCDVSDPTVLRPFSILTKERANGDDGYCVRHDMALRRIDPKIIHNGAVYRTGGEFDAYVCAGCLSETEGESYNDVDTANLIQQNLSAAFEKWDNGESGGEWFRYSHEGLPSADEIEWNSFYDITNPLLEVHNLIWHYHRQRDEIDELHEYHPPTDGYYPVPKGHAVYTIACHNQHSTKEFLKAGEGVYGDSDDIPSWAWAANHAERCVYVGYTSDPYQRITDHVSESDKGAKCTTLFRPEVIMDIHWYDDAIEAAEAEEVLADELEQEFPDAFVYQ